MPLYYLGYRRSMSDLSQIIAAPLPDKRLQLWGVAPYETIWRCHKQTTDPNSPFTDWEPFPKP